MGPLFVIILGAMLGATLGFGVGLVVSFAGVPLYYAFQNTPKEQRKITVGKKIVMAVFIAAGFGVLGGGAPLAVLVMEGINEGNYEESTGFGEWCRMPLEHPYELCTIAGNQDADIRTFKEEKYIIRGVTRYHREDSLIMGEYNTWVREPSLKWTIDTTYAESGRAHVDTNYHRDPGVSGIRWFTFDMSTGTVFRYETYEEYEGGLQILGFSRAPELKTIWENWR